MCGYSSASESVLSSCLRTHPLACSTQIPNVLSLAPPAVKNQGGQLAACLQRHDMYTTNPCACACTRCPRCFRLFSFLSAWSDL